jgi:hypothetical protein
MDSTTEASNLANIKASRFAFWQLVVTVAIGLPTLALLLLAQFYPPSPLPSQPPAGPGGVSMIKGWIPAAVAVLSFSLALSAISLLITTFRRLRNKRLAAEITRLNGEMATQKTATTNALKLAEERRKEAQFESTQKDGLSKTLQDRERQLADLESLRKIKVEQAIDIRDHVVITEVRPGKLALNTDGSVCIFLELIIRNESLWDITIRSEDVKGCFVRERRPFKEPVSMIVDAYRDPVENLPPFQYARLYLEQPLRDFEVELINKSLDAANARIWLGMLIVPISVGDGSKVETRNLKITPEEKEDAPLVDCRNDHS